MFLSGVLVSCRPEHFARVKALLEAAPGIEVHQSDQASGRFVVVIAEESIEAETERFRSLQQLEGVLDVSLVVHREDDGGESPENPGPAAEIKPRAP